MLPWGDEIRGLIASLLVCFLVPSVAMAADDVAHMFELIKQAGWDKDDNFPERIEIFNRVKILADASRENVEALQENADAMHEKENSTANKLIGALGIGATGVGAMQLMSGMAEKSADEDAENQMKAYMATFRCNYGGLSHKGGEMAIELPAGDLSALKQEYLTLAADLKIRKESLDMQPGIESEEILDATTAGLYDDKHTGKTDGQYTSVYRALSDETSEDAAEFAAQKEDAKKKVKTGAITAAVGAVGSLAANLAVNSRGPKDKSAELLRERETIMSDLDSVINDVIETCQAEIILAREYVKQMKKHVPNWAAHAPTKEMVEAIENAPAIETKEDITKIWSHPICR